MSFIESLYRADLVRRWRDYRETRRLPIAHEFAALGVRETINIIREYASRRNAARAPKWRS